MTPKIEAIRGKNKLDLFKTKTIHVSKNVTGEEKTSRAQP